MLVAKEKSTRNQSRLNIRLLPGIKTRIVRAAMIMGQDLTEFTSTTLSQRAEEIIENHEQILLSEKDYEFFLEALEKPARKPSEYSLKALEEYRSVFKRGSSS